ncbi:MAG: CHAD domain-containing protein [Capsulimonadaceae bacterium]|nr:CHAD domain-containing protein [Capsulimonadaceae bacterium]
MTEANETPLDGATPFRLAARTMVDIPLAEILRRLDGARAGDDVEAVHDLRVATRRLRAVLSVIEPAYAGKALRRFEKSIADMTDQLGEARDTDVFIEFLNERIAADEDGMAPYERVGLEAFRDSLRQARANQQVELEAALAHVDEEALRTAADSLFETEDAS